DRFLSLHRGPAPLVIPNPWDLGSAKVLVGMGFEALATTSGGFAATLGRVDGSVRRDESVAHAAAIVAAVDVLASADVENGFAHSATTGRLATWTGPASAPARPFPPSRASSERTARRTSADRPARSSRRRKAYARSSPRRTVTAWPPRCTRSPSRRTSSSPP